MRRDKPGYQYQLESVFSARQIGWDREHIGSHVIRRNTIYDCGQNGIVGHLGCVFSTIEDNHIYNIALKREFYGYEIAGIKLHAAIDVVIRHNRIHDCSLGTWLDWQTQGTRVSRNLFYANNRDLFVEVSHGPYLVEHNILASPASLELFSQGGAFVNNLVCGTVAPRAGHGPAPRPTTSRTARRSPATPSIFGGDDRYIGNVFLGGDVDDGLRRRRARLRPARRLGTAGYDGHPASFEDYLALIDDPAPRRPQALPGRASSPSTSATTSMPPAPAPYDAEDDPLVLDAGDRRRRRRGRRGLPRGRSCPTAFDRAARRARHRRRPRARPLRRRRLRGTRRHARHGSTPTSSASRKSDEQTYPAGPIATLAAGSSRIRVW